MSETSRELYNLGATIESHKQYGTPDDYGIALAAIRFLLKDNGQALIRSNPSLTELRAVVIAIAALRTLETTGNIGRGIVDAVNASSKLNVTINQQQLKNIIELLYGEEVGFDEVVNIISRGVHPLLGEIIRENKKE